MYGQYKSPTDTKEKIDLITDHQGNENQIHNKSIASLPLEWLFLKFWGKKCYPGCE